MPMAPSSWPRNTHVRPPSAVPRTRPSSHSSRPEAGSMPETDRGTHGVARSPPGVTTDAALRSAARCHVPLSPGRRVQLRPLSAVVYVTGRHRLFRPTTSRSRPDTAATPTTSRSRDNRLATGRSPTSRATVTVGLSARRQSPRDVRSTVPPGDTATKATGSGPCSAAVAVLVGAAAPGFVADGEAEGAEDEAEEGELEGEREDAEDRED